MNIPVSLVNGMNRREDVRFNLLRKSDHSCIHNKRVAEADDAEVLKEEIVRAGMGMKKTNTLRLPTKISIGLP